MNRDEFEFNIEGTVTKEFERQLLSVKKDDAVLARREARKTAAKKKSRFAVLTGEDILGAKIKRKKRRVTLKGLAYLAVFAAIIAVAAVSGIKLITLESEKNETSLKLSNLQDKKAELEIELENVNSEEYIENAAREDLHMIREGEVMYVIVPEEELDAGIAKP